MLDLYYTANMNDQQRVFFYQEYARVKKDEVVGVLFALLLGCFGIHKFYMGETGWGILYIVFSWTWIPAILGLIECFFMPGRVRRYNDGVAQAIAAGIGAGPGGYASAGAYGAAPFAAGATAVRHDSCAACGRMNEAGAAFCPGCGGAMAQMA